MINLTPIQTAATAANLTEQQTNLAVSSYVKMMQKDNGTQEYQDKVIARVIAMAQKWA